MAKVSCVENRMLSPVHLEEVVNVERESAKVEDDVATCETICVANVDFGPSVQENLAGGSVRIQRKVEHNKTCRSIGKSDADIRKICSL